MSIKRSREIPRRRAPENDGYAAKKETERVYAWDTDVAAQPAESFLAYAPAHRYSKDALLVHSVFGKGVVTRVEGTKIEVLFQAGPKKLAHNPTGSDAPKAVTPDQGTPPTQQQPPPAN